MADSKPEFLTACRFHVFLQPAGEEPSGADAIFLEFKGLKATQQVVEACEVTSGGRVVRTKIPGNIKYNNLILRRGMTNSLALWNWFDDVQNKQWGERRPEGKNFYVRIFNQSGVPTARYEFENAWPTSYKIDPLSAKSTNFEIEELEIAFEQFRRVEPK
jgi:phage tail-like protein